ncbi:MAG: ornithine cyclodeaminase family protein [Candidatus Promineifilaceae bacterium]
MRILSAADVRRALPMAEAIAGMKAAYSQLSAGRADVPLRANLNLEAHHGRLLVMPAYLPAGGELAVKVVAVFPDNAHHGRPTLSAAVLLLDAPTGRPLALLEGASLTAIRTGAGAGAATDALARPEASVVAVLGSGAQARSQLEAMCAVRLVAEVRVFSPNRAHAEAFGAALGPSLPAGARLRVTASPGSALRGADIICAATTSSRPVFDGRDLTPGAHINAIGSFTPQMQEVDAETVRRARVVVDSYAAALAEAGDLIIPLEAGIIGRDHIWAEIGEILSGAKPGRSDPEEITLFKSVGVAAQDAAAAAIAWRNAEALGLGQSVEW